MDGRVDGACWQSVPWETGFITLGPAAGGSAVSARIQTQFAMLWDEKRLYVAIRALEPQMNRLVARRPEHNENDGKTGAGGGGAGKADITATEPLFRDDHIELFLSAEKDRTDWRRFVVNSAGRRLAFAYKATTIVGPQFQEEAGNRLPTQRRVTWGGPQPMAAVFAPGKLFPQPAPVPGEAAPSPEDAAQWILACRHTAVSWETEMSIPLAALKIEPSEGATFAGNVGRTRSIGQPQTQQTTWTPLQNGFCDPDGFGTFTLAAKAPPLAATMSLAAFRAEDVVTTLLGDRLVGVVSGISEDGWLKLNAPQFQNEVSIREAALDTIEMSPTAEPGTGHRITLVNGDTFVAQIKTLGPEQAALASDALGALTIPTSAISAITLKNNSAQVMADTTFETGDMQPWTPVQGAWSILDGRLVFWGAPEGEGVLAALAPQKGAITLAADLEPIGYQEIACEVALVSNFVQTRHARSDWNGLAFTLERDGDLLEIYSAYNGSYNNVGVAEFPRVFPGGARIPRSGAKLRVSYDPANGSVLTWLDDQKGDEFKAAAAPKEGPYVLFTTRTPLAIRRLRLLRGVAPPAEQADPAGDAPRVVMSDGDIVTPKSVALADGRFLIKTDFGDMQPEMRDVAAVYLNRRSGPAKEGPSSSPATPSVTPPPPAGPAATPSPPPAPDTENMRVLTTDGQFTLRSCALSDDFLTGRSAFLGAISLKRDSLRLIRFFHSPQ